MAYRNWNQRLGPFSPATKGEKRAPRSALMSGATRIGITVEAYMEKIEDGLRWCSHHKTWEAVANFTPKPSSVTGVVNYCRQGAREYAAQGHATGGAWTAGAATREPPLAEQLIVPARPVKGATLTKGRTTHGANRRSDRTGAGAFAGW